MSIAPGLIHASAEEVLRDVADAFGVDSLDKTCMTAPTAPATGSRTRIGGYELVRKLGEGGMGTVYLARDPKTETAVALKVLSERCLKQPDALARFEKEARLLKEAENPFIANLIEWGHDGPDWFLVMEYVDGCDLRRWMSDRGRLDESLALDLLSDLCRALLPVHAREMVHRDLKPENILLTQLQAARPTPRLTDFGLARHIQQTESLQLTRTGALLGTPYYMAPEQFKGTGEYSTATDVYALGVTLFEMLAGRRPFQATDPIRLATAHCFEAPADLKKLSPYVSESTADLVRRMLAKSPAERPQNAAAVLEAIAQLHRGGTTHLALHPTLPDHDATQVLAADFAWPLTAAVETLWPLVSDTDRFNQAAGIPPVTYEVVRDEAGQTQKFGSFRLAGVPVRWQEHPFEWVEGRRFSVLREFPSGPFVWFLSSVELTAQPDGGTLVQHHVRILPRGIAGRLLARLEVGVKGKRALDRIYRRIDAVASTRGNRLIDPYQIPRAPTRSQAVRMQVLLDQLRNRGVREEVAGALHQWITHAAPQELARIRPVALARRFDLEDHDVIAACLHGTANGLLTMHWDLLCPGCRLPVETRQTLREIGQHGRCDACQTEFQVDFGTSLELVFRAHPDVRATDARLYCNGGPGNFPHIAAQVRLEPGERIVLPMTLDAGTFVLRGPCLPMTIPIEVEPRSGARYASVRLAPGPARPPVPRLQAGPLQLTLENEFALPQLVRLERCVPHDDVLTSAQATANPVFRELFPQESLQPGQLMHLAVTTFLAVQIDELEVLFAEAGDAGAYQVLQDVHRCLHQVTAAQGGMIIENSPGQILACFPDLVSPIQTVRRIREGLQSCVPGHAWSFSGAIHRGPALVTSDRVRIQYFGAVIHETQRLARRAQPGSVQLARSVWAEPMVQDAFGADWRIAAEPEVRILDSTRDAAVLTPSTQITKDETR